MPFPYLPVTPIKGFDGKFSLPLYACPNCGEIPRIVEIRRMFYALGKPKCPFCGQIHDTLGSSGYKLVIANNWNRLVERAMS